MQTAILAGGKGTRISELFPDIPKPMIPILGKPILQHQIELLVKQSFTEIILIVGYKSDIIKNYFGNGEKFGCNIEYITENEPLGTGGALCLLPEKDTLLLMGDTYLHVDFNKFYNFHKSQNADITLFVHPNSHPFDSDIVIAKNNRVVDWSSKKMSNRGDLKNLVNAGLYIFSAENLPKGKAEKCDLDKDIIRKNINNLNIFAYKSTEYIKDMGTPERLTEVENAIRNNIPETRNLFHKQKCVFVDRDGTLNIFKGLIIEKNQIELIENVTQAVSLLNDSEYLIICVTNQPQVARGMLTFEEVEEINAKLETLLGEQGAYLDDIFYCPHHPDSGYPEEVKSLKIKCDCRKPNIGMISAAQKIYNIDLTQSYMIGDTTGDILCGKNAGCKTIGVKTGESLNDKKYNVQPDFLTENFYEAVKLILG
jgi:D,D-heptose 1,7-bisphosphate phosphatase